MKIKNIKRIEPTIKDFIKKVRFETERLENEKTNNENESMIEDSRERRLSKLSEFPCDQCGYKTPSRTLLKKYRVSIKSHVCNVITNLHQKVLSKVM